MNSFRLVTLAVVLIFPSLSQAHFHMLMPEKSEAKTDEAITFTYQFGHPFEHELFETQKPSELYVVAPDGTKTDLLTKLEKVSVDGAEGKKVTGYTFTFKPMHRGDYTIVAVSPEIKLADEPTKLRDVAKVVLHVQAQKNWDRRVVTAKSCAIELSPLTRPYGVKSGMAFHVEADEPSEAERKVLPRLKVEVERYNPMPPKVLPPDLQVTRTARTSRAGDSIVTLTEPGWWCITATRERDSMQHRCTLWVFVD